MKFELVEMKKNLHILEGLEKVLTDSEECIKVIRFTDDGLLKGTLMKSFDIDEEQFNFIIKMSIRNINKDYITKKISERKELDEKIKNLLVNVKDEKYINAKKVIAAMSDRSMKTLNIEYKKYDKTMKFKIEGGTHISSNTEGFYISNYRICNNSDRELFKKTFNNSDKYGEDIYLQNIESITYGRKVLYKK
jgi:DNA gyrase subunit A